MKLIHRSRWAACLAVGLLVVTVAQPANAATLSGTTFDAGNGDFVTSLSGETDWSSSALHISCLPDGNDSSGNPIYDRSCRPDVASGKNDDAFGNGAKEDTVNPSVVTGAIPPNKSDLTRFYSKVVTINNVDYAYLGWERQNNPSGTTNMDFELNQNNQGAPLQSDGTPLRQPGDVLIDFHLASGGTNPQLIWYKWTDGSLKTSNGAQLQCEASSTFPCWGAGTTITNGVSLDTVQASVNTGTVYDPYPPLASNATAQGSPLDPYTFGEAAVNLEKAGIIAAGSCVTLNNAFLKSRSSDSFTSEIKDFIKPLNLGFQKCGTITVQKKTIGSTGTFHYTDVLNGTPGSPFSITTTTAGTAVSNAASTFKQLIPGTYTFTEDTANGWTLTNLSCTNGTATNSFTTSTASVTLAAGDNWTCTFENTAEANLHVSKVTIPNPDTAKTSFTFTGDLAGPLQNGSAINNLNVLPNKSYTSTENTNATAPRWDLKGIACTNTKDGSATANASNSGSTATFTPQPGDDLTCTFTNQERGKIVVNKQDDQGNTPASLDGAVFTLLDSSGHALTTNLPDSTTCTITSGTCSFTNVYPGTYTVHESTAPAGYAAGPDVSNVVVNAGAGYDSNVPAAIVTVQDPRQFTVIVLVCKNADHSLYSSSVSLDSGTAVGSLGSAPAGGPNAATLCALGGASFSPEGAGGHMAAVTIPK